MAARKTVDVAYMKEYANTFLMGEAVIAKEMRLGVAVMIEEILFQTGNYKGYKLLDVGGDESRRCYY